MRTAQAFWRWLRPWLTTVDHKRIGILYLVSAAFFFAVGGVEAFLIRLQLMHPGSRLIVGDTYNGVVTLHGFNMILFAIMPLFLGFVNYVVPLQIGARDLAFPFLNALSFWLFLAGAVVFNWSIVAGQYPNDGWFAYAPLTLPAYTPGLGPDFYALGGQISGVGTLITGVNFVVTILNGRAPGMTLRRMPLFTWAALITSTMIVFAFPPLAADLFLLTFDRFLDANFFNVSLGGNVLIWQHLFWIFGHPEVYILILPAFGIVSEVVATFSRKSLFGYDSMVLALAAIAFLSFVVWSHHMFTAGMGPVVNGVFSVTTMMIAIPTGIKIFNWLATMWGGRIRFTTAMLYAVGFIPIFVLGGVTGVMVAMAPADYQYNMTYFVVAHFHYTMVGGSLFALLSAYHYWFPKIWGRMLDERLGKLSFWLVFTGFNVTFFPQHFLGLFGMPRRVYTYPDDWGLTTLNLVSTAGVFVLTAGFLVLLGNTVAALVRGERAPADPWDARTLEWSLPTPVPEYGFARIPLVTSRDAFWAMKKKASERETGSAPAPEEIHLPPPSALPFLIALGAASASFGLIYGKPWLGAPGAALVAFGLYRGMFGRAPGVVVRPAEEVRA
ncbi:MAG: cytochrome c oxidase subunit I [Clostridia bacterium]|nr:cytochrome c oxidase subunit I [Clostridia bacterium]